MADPDDALGAIVFARIPEQLDDMQRQKKYDEPLAAMLLQEGVGEFTRGYSLAGHDGRIEWIGLDMTLRVYHSVSFIADALIKLGAPPETVIEAETKKAAVSFTLNEAGAR